MSLLDGAILLRDTPEFPYWERRLRDECVRSGRFGRNFVLVLLAVDRDAATAPHPLSPEVMDALSDNLRSGVRSVDLVAQVGNCLFAVMLVGATTATGGTIAARLVERVQEAVAALPPPATTSPVVCGVATFGLESEGPEQLVGAAEADLLQAIAASRRQADDQADAPADDAAHADTLSPCDVSLR